MGVPGGDSLLPARLGSARLGSARCLKLLVLVVVGGGGELGV